MSTVVFLVLFPLLVALILIFIKSDSIRKPIVIASAILMGLFSVLLVFENYGRNIESLWEIGSVVDLISIGPGGSKFFVFSADGAAAGEMISNIMMAIEVMIAAVIIWMGIKYKNFIAPVLTLIQLPLLIWFELNVGHEIDIQSYIYIDNFSMIMILIIGIIGTLICVYSVAYMRDFQEHQEGANDRRPWFFFLMFIFLSAMFGIVVSNNIIWMYFFWEVTTLCSFFLIGYTKTKEAVKNSFRALNMNLLGGVAFVLGIIAMGGYMDILELDKFLEKGIEVQQATEGSTPAISLILTLLVFAGMTKAAQMPFNSWLLGAMVAPTPTSALLHSSTMVKAGVFLIVKLSPLLGVDSIIDIGPGFMAIMVGGVTFLLSSFCAVTQSNAKRVLAYSTISNLGLIVACAGLGTPEGVWAAEMLIIFHAVTKSLLFLCVGTAEHNIGSRDIEDMDGLFEKLPKLAVFMIIGIAAMFLAPFGMLISKWAALQSFVDSGNIWVILMIVFGSAVTLFYWGKWLGKMVAVVPHIENVEHHIQREEWFVIGTQVGLVVLSSLSFPFISNIMVLPYLHELFEDMSEHIAATLSGDNMMIMVVMVALILILPLLFYGKSRKKIVPIYMSGVNEGDDITFVGSMNNDVKMSLRNWYMEDIFNEKIMNTLGIIVTCVIFTMTFSYIFAIGVYLADIMGAMGGVR